jgi:hypothetical protein
MWTPDGNIRPINPVNPVNPIGIQEWYSSCETFNDVGSGEVLVVTALDVYPWGDLDW